MSDVEQDRGRPADIDEVLLALQRMNISVKKTARGAVRADKVDKYADLPAVNEQVLTALNGMDTTWSCVPTLLPDSQQGPGRFVLRYKLKHVPSKTSLDGDYPLGAGKPQEMGSAITYARRYALLAVTGVVAEDDDDDGQGGTGTARRKPRETRPREAATVARPSSAPALPDTSAPATAPGEWTQPMMRKWMAQNREAGITGDAVKAVAADMLGRQVESSKEITFDEMRGMIDAFEKALKDPDTAAATVIDIYQRTTGSASAPATAARRPAKRAAPAETRTVQEQTRDAVLGTPGPESVPWEGELPV